jgi:DNA-binding MarR family transcriptional regulator/GNAT superfamily N-acetyltransferase
LCETARAVVPAPVSDYGQRIDPVTTVRRFNRSYTQRIGALEDSFLGVGLPLGPARVLFEIGAAPGTTFELRHRLGLDSGYLSRLLRELEGRGYVAVAPDAADRRRRRVTLTRAGRKVWAELDRRSDARAHRLLDPLGASQRARLVEALATADKLVRAATVQIDEVDPDRPEARASVAAYFAELDRRFPTGFDPGEDAARDRGALRPPDGTFLLARSDDDAVACGGVQALDGTVGEIKRMWVHPEWRGVGLGARMLQHLEQHARRIGYDTVRLDTNDVLTEAITMYERAGYRSIPRYNDNPYARRWFEKRLP